MPLLHLRNTEAPHEINLAPEEMDMAPEDIHADETRWYIVNEEALYAGEFDPGWVYEDDPEG